jgi:hypothetical protein
LPCAVLAIESLPTLQLEDDTYAQLCTACRDRRKTAVATLLDGVEAKVKAGGMHARSRPARAVGRVRNWLASFERREALTESLRAATQARALGLLATLVDQAHELGMVASSTDSGTTIDERAPRAAGTASVPSGGGPSGGVEPGSSSSSTAEFQQASEGFSDCDDFDLDAILAGAGSGGGGGGGGGTGGAGSSSSEDPTSSSGTGVGAAVAMLAVLRSEEACVAALRAGVARKDIGLLRTALDTAVVLKLGGGTFGGSNASAIGGAGTDADACDKEQQQALLLQRQQRLQLVDRAQTAHARLVLLREQDRVRRKIRAVMRLQAWREDEEEQEAQKEKEGSKEDAQEEPVQPAVEEDHGHQLESKPDSITKSKSGLESVLQVPVSVTIAGQTSARTRAVLQALLKEAAECGLDEDDDDDDDDGDADADADADGGNSDINNNSSSNNSSLRGRVVALLARIDRRERVVADLKRALHRLKRRVAACHARTRLLLPAANGGGNATTTAASSTGGAVACAVSIGSGAGANVDKPTVYRVGLAAVETALQAVVVMLNTSRSSASGSGGSSSSISSSSCGKSSSSDSSSDLGSSSTSFSTSGSGSGDIKPKIVWTWTQEEEDEVDALVGYAQQLHHHLTVVDMLPSELEAATATVRLLIRILRSVWISGIGG